MLQKMKQINRESEWIILLDCFNHAFTSRSSSARRNLKTTELLYATENETDKQRIGMDHFT